jgi:hypothetical protein
MAKGRKTGGRRTGSLNKATLGVKELLSCVLPTEENKRVWRKFLNHRDQRIRWEAFKLAQSYMFGKPVQPVVDEEMAPPIKIDISAIPKKRELA